MRSICSMRWIRSNWSAALRSTMISAGGGGGAGRGGRAASTGGGGASTDGPLSGASEYGLVSPELSVVFFDRGRPRRLGFLGSVIRKLRVIRGLSSGRTEHSAKAQKGAMGLEKPSSLVNSRGAALRWKCGIFRDGFGRAVTQPKGRKAPFDTAGVRDMLARPTHWRGMPPTEMIRHPVGIRCEACKLRIQRTRRHDPGRPAFAIATLGVLRSEAICATRPAG